MVIGGVTNFNVPGDTDGTANGKITASLNFYYGELANISGNFFYVLSSPVGHFAPITNSFVVTNFPFAQKFTGNVVSNGTSSTVPNAIVVLFPPLARAPALAATVANNAGNYTIYAPPGAYTLGACNSKYVGYGTSATVFTLGSGQTVATNLTATNATASISGNLVDASTGIGLPGVMMKVQQSTNGLKFLALAFTDTNGAFSVSVTPGAWTLSPALSLHGYVEKAHKTTASAGTTGIFMYENKATALFYGSVKDILGNPMPALDVDAQDGNAPYAPGCYTDGNGNYVLGVMGLGASDSWSVEANDDGQLTNYDFSVQTNYSTIIAGQAMRQNFSAILATNYITGWVKDQNGNPIANASIGNGASINGLDYNCWGNAGVDTDANGNYTLNVCNGSWYIVAENLPTNYLSVSPADTNVTIFNNSAVVNFTVTLPPFQVTTITLPIWTNGFAYSQQLSAANGQTPYSWSLLAGSLPSGLTLATNGMISGTPTNGGGTNSFTVKVTDAANNTSTQILTLVVVSLQVTTSAMPAGTNGVTYRQQLSAIYGHSPYSWTNIFGSLPPGLNLATNGVISGTPTNNGAFYFTVKVTDALSNTATQALELTVDTPPQVATVTLPNGLTGVAYSQQLSAIFGQPPYSWSIISDFWPDGLPDGLELTTNGLISGTPTRPEIASFTVMVTDELSATGTMPLTLAISSSNSVSVFTPLYNFSRRDYTYYTNSDGCYPEGGLILLGNTLYGMTEQGGPFEQGTVFAVNINDTGFTNLHSFTGFNPAEGGSGSFTHLVSSGSRLYGTTSGGGTHGVGTVFSGNTDGTGFTNLYCFSALDFSYYTNSDGALPMGGLVLSGNNLYGTTWTGGRSGNGTVFTVSTNANGFTNLYNFVPSFTNSFGDYTNSSGASPNAPLLLLGNRLYGTANLGGSSGNGTVFAVNTDGSGFSNLYCFSGWSDGSSPNGGLLLSGNTLYGTTSSGGSNYAGVVFAINTDGTDFTNLYVFSGWSDGGGPNGGLLLSGNTLYGTTYWGGNNNAGSVFAISTNGTDFTNLYLFDRMNEGPNGDLLLTGNTLYGTTEVGGNSDFGTIFSLSLLGMAPSSNSTIIMLSSPQITIGKTNFTFQLTGPAGSNYVLLVSTNLLNWTTNSTSTIPASGTLTLTNAITNYNRRFYRVHLQ
jgi:uncharacterized repeat protein (TIGR03803 family)